MFPHSFNKGRIIFLLISHPSNVDDAVNYHLPDPSSSSTMMTRFLATPLYLFITCYLLVQAGYFLYKQTTIRLARHRLIKEHGCKPPRSSDDKTRLPRLYRLKLINTVKNAAKDRRLLESSQERYQAYGNTHSAGVNFHPNYNHFSY